MFGANKTRALMAVTLTLIMILLSQTVVCFEPTNAQSTDNTTVTLTKVTNAYLAIPHIWGNSFVMQLEKGDHVEGNYTISNIHYYPNWHNLLLKAEVLIRDPIGQTIYHAYTRSWGLFNFTASQSGNYTLLTTTNLVHELVHGPYYYTRALIVDAEPLEMSLNYTITGAPFEISIVSPVNQTYFSLDVLLDFASSRVYDWVGYSLDDAEAVSICHGNSSVPINGSSSQADSVSTHFGNTTLTNLSMGAHTLTFYANDTYGNMASQTVAFTVGSSAVAPSVPLLIVVIFAVVIGVLAVALLYRRHRVLNLPITS
jgi:hypothetical protein